MPADDMVHSILAAISPTPVPQNLTFNEIAFAVVALIHQQYATFLTGAATLAMISEGIAISRHDERHTRLAAGLVKAMAYLFSFGAALPIFWVIVIMVGLWGTFFVALTRITYWIFILEACLFLLEIVLLYGIYANWGRLARHRNARYGLLILLNVALFWQFFMIDVVASYMLTPNGGDTNQLAQVLNPTNLPLSLHRFIGNIAWAGAAMAGFAAIRYRRAVRHEERLLIAASAGTAGAGSSGPRSVGAMSAAWFRDEGLPHETEAPRPGTRPGDRGFYDFVIQWGVLFAVGMTLFQPWVGYSYAKEVQLHAYSAWYNMMYGDLSNWFLVQITLLGLIFVLGAFFFWRRMVACGAPGARHARNAFIMLCGVTAFLAIPARFAWTTMGVDQAGLDKPWWEGGLRNPIGTFIPNKVIGLLLLMAGGLWALTAYLVANSRDQLRFGNTPRRAMRAVFALTVTVSIMMAVMGYIREHSRRPYLIYGEMTISGQRITNENEQTPQHALPAPTEPPRSSPAAPSVP